MELNRHQFRGFQDEPSKELKPLNKYVKRFYPQVTEQLSIAIKQAKLAKMKKELDATL
jgi:hypothetical protein